MPRKSPQSRFEKVMIDVCGMTVTHENPSDLKLLLRKIGVEFKRPPIGHPFEHATVQVSSPEDMNLLLLYLYGDAVDATQLCRRPPRPRSDARIVYTQPKTVYKTETRTVYQNAPPDPRLWDAFSAHCDAVTSFANRGLQPITLDDIS